MSGQDIGNTFQHGVADGKPVENKEAFLYNDVERNREYTRVINEN